MIETRVWIRPMTVGHIGSRLPYASCLVLRIWLIALAVLLVILSCIPSRAPKERPLTFSARTQSPTKRRAWYFSPLIVSAFGTTVFEIRPIAHRRESGRSSGGIRQLVFSRMRSLYIGTL